MKKIILNFEGADTRDDVQEYLAMKFDFPDYYGMNLDALYDCLTDIDEDTCVGIFIPEFEEPLASYLEKMKRVFRDAEDANRHIGVIFGDPEENYGEEEYS